LLQAPSGFFMYRDFQSRNIMVRDSEILFIDYQGGRRGALQYDIASLLYDAKANIPEEAREQLLDLYLEEVERYLPGQRSEFMRFYPGFILIRILQALGAYGFRGYYEKKSHFLQSIPFAISNLRNLRDLWIKDEFGISLPTLFSLLDRIIDNPAFRHPEKAREGLTVTITSFSYQDGFPQDSSEHGGGFVFDCRALPNPGREEAFRSLTGKDKEVISFLQSQPEVDRFLEHAFLLVSQSVKNYSERGFQHLFVGFGCTGGQHRSVYCAEALGARLSEEFQMNIIVNHAKIRD